MPETPMTKPYSRHQNLSNNKKWTLFLAEADLWRGWVSCALQEWYEPTGSTIGSFTHQGSFSHATTQWDWDRETEGGWFFFRLGENSQSFLEGCTE